MDRRSQTEEQRGTGNMKGKDGQKIAARSEKPAEKVRTGKELKQPVKGR